MISKSKNKAVGSKTKTKKKAVKKKAEPKAEKSRTETERDGIVIPDTAIGHSGHTTHTAGTQKQDDRPKPEEKAEPVADEDITMPCTFKGSGDASIKKPVEDKVDTPPVNKPEVKKSPILIAKPLPKAVCGNCQRPTSAITVFLCPHCGKTGCGLCGWNALKLKNCPSCGRAR